MPPSKRHCTGNLHPAFSGQLAGIRVAEDSVGALALLPTVHCDPKGSIRNVAYWGRRVHAAIIPVSTSVCASHLNWPVTMLSNLKCLICSQCHLFPAV
jgi:hypothetical protein